MSQQSFDLGVLQDALDGFDLGNQAPRFAPELTFTGGFSPAVRLRLVQYTAGHLRISTVASTRDNPEDPGPHLSAKWTRSYRAVTLRKTNSPSDSFTVVGPNHPHVPRRDTTEPYSWQVPPEFETFWNSLVGESVTIILDDAQAAEQALIVSSGVPEVSVVGAPILPDPDFRMVFSSFASTRTNLLLLVDSYLVENEATAYLREFDLSGNSVRFKLSSTTRANPEDEGPHLTTEWENYEYALTLKSEVGTIYIAGPGHASSSFRDSDREPYWWVPGNSEAMEAWRNASVGKHVEVEFRDGVVLRYNEGTVSPASGPDNGATVVGSAFNTATVGVMTGTPLAKAVGTGFNPATVQAQTGTPLVRVVPTIIYNEATISAASGFPEVRISAPQPFFTGPAVSPQSGLQHEVLVYGYPFEAGFVISDPGHADMSVVPAMFNAASVAAENMAPEVEVIGEGIQLYGENTFTENLTVYEDAEINKLTVTGTATLPTLASLTVTDLTVTDAASLPPVAPPSDISITTLTVSGKSTLTRLTVSGTSTLAITNVSSLMATGDVSGATATIGTLTVSTSLVLPDNTLTVGNANLTGNLDVEGSTTTDILTANEVTINDTITFPSGTLMVPTANVTGNLTVNGTATVDGDATFKAPVTLEDTLTAESVTADSVETDSLTLTNNGSITLGEDGDIIGYTPPVPDLAGATISPNQVNTNSLTVNTTAGFGGDVSVYSGATLTVEDGGDVEIIGGGDLRLSDGGDIILGSGSTIVGYTPTLPPLSGTALSVASLTTNNIFLDHVDISKTSTHLIISPADTRTGRTQSVNLGSPARKWNYLNINGTTLSIQGTTTSLGGTNTTVSGVTVTLRGPTTVTSTLEVNGLATFKGDIRIDSSSGTSDLFIRKSSTGSNANIVFEEANGTDEVVIALLGPNQFSLYPVANEGQDLFIGSSRNGWGKIEIHGTSTEMDGPVKIKDDGGLWLQRWSDTSTVTRTSFNRRFSVRDQDGNTIILYGTLHT